MKLKKILAAIAACSVCAAMTGITVFAEGDTAEPTDIVDEPADGDEELDGEEEEGDGEEEGGDEEEGDGEEEGGDEEEGDGEEEGSDVGNEEENTSPKTGNSPIAMAVIPVALAAAAVVAKKAK